jgi:hypothetical protein
MNRTINASWRMAARQALLEGRAFVIFNPY